MQEVTFHDDRQFTLNDILPVYSACDWSSAHKPDELFAALQGSHTVIHARIDQRLVGIGNAISDGHLVVYYPHLLVHPDVKGKGIGSGILKRLAGPYTGFHQQVLISDADAVEFYQRNGFSQAGRTIPMWVYDGDDH